MKSLIQIFAFLIIISLTASAQTNHSQASQNKFEAIAYKVYSVEQMHEDLDVLEKKLCKYHPDPYHYITKDSLHQFVQDLKKQIDQPLTDIKFRFYARQVIAKIGCGHTVMTPSKAYIKVIDSVNRKVMPLDFWLLDTNRLFVRNYLLPDNKLKPGDEILSINGHSANEILSKMYSTLGSDGDNTTFKKQNLQGNRIRYFYAAAYDYDSLYQIKVRTRGGFEKDLTVNNLFSKADTVIPPNNKKYTIIYKNQKALFKIDTVNPHLAILDINNFAGRKWRKLMRLSFRYIRKHKEITALAVDLRDNGGGSVAKGNYFMSYLLPKSFCTRFGRRVNIIPFTGGLKLNAASRATRFSFIFYPVSWVHKNKWTHWFVHFPKKRNHFDGQLYVLTNGRSFSMSVVTASYLKHKAGAALIGEETGGTQTGSNAMLSGKIILPNSKAQVIIPLYRIDHCVDVPDTKRGLMPDYPCIYTIEDLMKGRDLEIEKVRELMESK